MDTLKLVVKAQEYSCFSTLWC